MRCDYCGEKHDESECPRQLAQIEAEKRKVVQPSPGEAATPTKLRYCTAQAETAAGDQSALGKALVWTASLRMASDDPEEAADHMVKQDATIARLEAALAENARKAEWRDEQLTSLRLDDLRTIARLRAALLAAADAHAIVADHLSTDYNWPRYPHMKLALETAVAARDKARAAAKEGA